MLFIIILVIILILVILNTYYFTETFEGKNKYNTKLGAKKNHLEIAYQLCSTDFSPDCQKYVKHFEQLRKTFHRLKKNYCKNNKQRCKELRLQ